MKTLQFISKALISTIIGLGLSAAFNLLFLNWLERPRTDQTTLIVLPALAVGYLAYSILEGPGKLKQAWTALLEKRPNWKLAAVLPLLREHAPGLILSLIFLLIYSSLGLQFNSPGLDTTDNYLDADNSTWMRRIAWPDGSLFEMRGPHPFAYLIFRPLGWAFNLFLRDPFLSALMLNTLAGAACVFLTWMFIKNRLKNKTYALLIAALLGISTSHLWFGSIIESYIFAAAGLIAFFVILGQVTDLHKGSDAGLIIASLVTFGITLTNVIQPFIGFLVDRSIKPSEEKGDKSFWRKLNGFIRFAGIVISLGVILSLIHAAWFPSARLFFLPSDAGAEREFSISIFREPGWRAIGRVTLLIRTILLYTVVAPRPFVFSEEVGGFFPRFNFFRITPGEYAFSSYDGVGTALVFLWTAILLAAGFFFLRNLLSRRQPGLTLAFLLCIGFNFFLHLGYGYEPFLYSPDWAYALVFFVALALGELADERWFHAVLMAFIVTLAYNQWLFFRYIFEAISPFLN